MMISIRIVVKTNVGRFIETDVGKFRFSDDVKIGLTAQFIFKDHGSTVLTTSKFWLRDLP